MTYDADAENECERRDKCNWDPLCPNFIACWEAEGGHPDDRWEQPPSTIATFRSVERIDGKPWLNSSTDDK